MTIFPYFREESGSEHVRFRPQTVNEPLGVPVGRFLADLISTQG